jgi:hypothetical protein
VRRTDVPDLIRVDGPTEVGVKAVVVTGAGAKAKAIRRAAVVMENTLDL